MSHGAEDSRFIPTALPPTEVIYFQTRTDAQGQILDASKGANYTITFPLPLPARAFWSLTIYNATSLLLFQNPIDRYNIADRVSPDSHHGLQLCLAQPACVS